MPGRLIPIEGARLPSSGTRVYGAVREPTVREPAGHVHAGIDIAARPGTIVRAPEDGTVEVATVEGRRGSGWSGYAPVVVLRGQSGVWHVLAHLSGGPLLVRAGELIVAGAPVGSVGSERHTHWEVRRSLLPHGREPASTVTVDPTLWLAAAEGGAGPFVPELPSRSVQCRAPGNPRRPRAVAARWRSSLSCSCSAPGGGEVS